MIWRTGLLKLEIALLLPIMAAAVRLVPLRHIYRLARSTSAAPLSEDQLALALCAGDAGSRYYAWKWTRNECLARCTTVKLVLARRGIGTVMSFGIRKLGSAAQYNIPDLKRDYRAHAWLDTCDGKALVEDGRAHYAFVGKLN